MLGHSVPVQSGATESISLTNILRQVNLFATSFQLGHRPQRISQLLALTFPFLLSLLTASLLVWSIRDTPLENASYRKYSVLIDLKGPTSFRPLVDDVLLTSYQIPSSVLNVLPYSDKYELLTLLQNGDAKERPAVLVSHIVGTNATGRLAAVASSLSYANLMNRILIIIWDNVETSHHLVLKEMDSSNIFFTSAPDLGNLFKENRVVDPAAYHWDVRKCEGHASLPAEHEGKHMFMCASNSVSGSYVQTMAGIERLYSSFKPSPSLENSFASFVNPFTFPNLSPSELSDRLHRLFSVPRVFLAEMSDTNQRRLLHKLEHSKSKRVFFLHAQFGLGNRLRALGSAMAVAHVSGFVLVLIWVPDVHLSCAFNDLFVNDMVVMSKFSMEWPPSAIHSNDRALSSVDFYNFMRHEGNKQVHNPAKVYVNPRVGRHVYAKTAYVVQSKYTPRIISYSSAFWNTMRETLVPVPDVMSVVEQPDLRNIRQLIGVHIRSRRIKDDIKGVGQEFYGKGSITTDYWRNRTNLSTFARKIASLPKRYRYFVAADTPDATNTLKKQFGSHRFYGVSNEMQCVSRSVMCAKLALADIILLSRTRVLLGSHWSSFSEAAVRMSGRMKVHLAGLHFS